MNTLSIGYTDRFLRFLGMNGDNRIVYADQIELYGTDEVFIQAKPKAKVIQQIGNLIKSTISKSGFRPERTAFALDSSIAFINEIPVDYSDDAGSINSNILWELSNYFPDSYKNYKVNYLKLAGGNDGDSRVRRTLIIAVHKNDAETVQRLSEIADIKFFITDIDHFSAPVYFSYINNYLNSNTESIIIGSKKQRIDISTMRGGVMKHYDYTYTRDSAYSEQIKEIISGIIESSSDFKIKSINLYGEDNTTRTGGYIEEICKGISIDISNPFKTLLSSEDYSGISPDEIRGYNFTSLAGLALKSSIG
ncbi:MAG: pilus assembly protein PilM [Ignavibacteriae bacterium]|nr:pilus assembly protein PilM [Ignavibacteriota bacterium]